MSTKRTQRKPRVFWTNEELESVIKEAVQVALQDEEFIWSFISKGQLRVLPKERQRTITGRNAVNDRMARMFCEERQKVLDEGTPYPVVIEEETREVLVERPRAELLESITTEELICIIAKRMAPIIDLIPTLLTKGGDKIMANEFTDSSQLKVINKLLPTKRKVRVLLIGFLPDQEKEIQSKSENFNLELMFQRKDANSAVPPPSCQWCVVFQKVSHSTFNKAKGHFGSKKLFFSTGIADTMKKLADINSKATP